VSKYIIVVLQCIALFLVASVAYGYLTGTSFFIRGVFARSPMFDVIVVMLIFLSIYGIVIFFSQRPECRSFQLGDWLLPVLSGFAPTLFLRTQVDYGEIFRFYACVLWTNGCTRKDCDAF